jgi:hypothetical protein
MTLQPAIPLGTHICISNSEIGAFRRCPRRWLCGYYFGLQVPEYRASPTSTSRLGTRLHCALEGYYGYGMEPAHVLHAAYQLAMEDYPAAHADLLKEYDLAQVIIAGYLEWLEQTGEDSGLTPLAVETVKSAEAGVIEGVVVTLQARLDTIFGRQSDGALVFMDHKSVGGFEKEQLLPQDPQMRFQTLIQRLSARADGTLPLVDGVLFNQLKRSKRTERAKGPFYHRVPVIYNNEQMTATWLNVTRTITKMIEARRELDGYFAGDRGSYTTEQARTQVQRWLAGPVIGGDCSWGCPFEKECIMMDDGSRWESALENNFIKAKNPYSYLDTALLDELQQRGKL